MSIAHKESIQVERDLVKAFRKNNSVNKDNLCYLLLIVKFGGWLFIRSLGFQWE